MEVDADDQPGNMEESKSESPSAFAEPQSHRFEKANVIDTIEGQVDSYQIHKTLRVEDVARIVYDESDVESRAIEAFSPSTGTLLDSDKLETAIAVVVPVLSEIRDIISSEPSMKSAEVATECVSELADSEQSTTQARDDNISTSLGDFQAATCISMDCARAEVNPVHEEAIHPFASTDNTSTEDGSQTLTSAQTGYSTLHSTDYDALQLLVTSLQAILLKQCSSTDNEKVSETCATATPHGVAEMSQSISNLEAEAEHELQSLLHLQTQLCHAQVVVNTLIVEHFQKR